MMTLHLTALHPGGQSLGRLCFVDLAGSERVMESRTTGDALKETAHINKSLFTLGNVISSLADPRRHLTMTLTTANPNSPNPTPTLNLAQPQLQP